MTTVFEEGEIVLVVLITEKPSILFSPFSYNIQVLHFCILINVSIFVFKKGKKVVICASRVWLLILWGFCVILGVCCCFFNTSQGVLQLYTFGRNLDTLLMSTPGNSAGA